MEIHCCSNTKEKMIIGFNNLRLLLLVFVSAALIVFCLFNNFGRETETGSMLMSITNDHGNHLLQNSNVLKTMEVVKVKLTSVGGVRGLLGGLGSSPPQCNSKCGTCTPCEPVSVQLPPETPITTEYRPEVWRCKCGNNLYMPN